MSEKKSMPLIKEVVLKAPVEKIWKAITDNEEMKSWYFSLDEFKPVVGFEFQFYGGKDDRQYLHLCKITEVVVNKKLTYSWRYDGYPGVTYVTFELISEGKNTRVKLSHTGLESFPDDNPDFNKVNFAEGWNMIIGTFLKDYVEKN